MPLPLGVGRRWILAAACHNVEGESRGNPQVISMTTVSDPPTIWTAADLFERFGPIPMNRICTDPAPGLATEDDVVWFDDHKDRLYELVDGVLVEKSMSSYESFLAIEIAWHMQNYVKPRRLGAVLGADGMLKLAPGLIRAPDVSFLAMDKFPGGRFPRERIAPLAPDIAVEVLSPSNTRQEMAEKLSDYFRAGTRLVWCVDPRRREVQVFTSVSDCRVLTEADTLDGGDVLPGFELNLRELFAELPPEA
jgi:Uma2 family endonuclease